MYFISYVFVIVIFVIVYRAKLKYFHPPCAAV